MPRTSNEKRHLSQAEAAARAGVCVRTIQSLIKEQRLIPVRFGRRVLIPIESLDRLLAGRIDDAR